MANIYNFTNLVVFKRLSVQPLLRYIKRKSEELNK